MVGARETDTLGSRPMVITFLTDFGLQDDFVGTCHGVIKRIAPDAQIIDITHGIPAQAVLQGALVLANTLPPPPGSTTARWTPPGMYGSVLASTSAPCNTANTLPYMPVGVHLAVV